jgi:glutathionylspermidine synthase
MYRSPVDPRPNWQKRVEEYGLMYHTLRGEPYWDESAAYYLSRFEVDTLEFATNTLHEMCMEVVQEVIDDRLFNLFLSPPEFHETVIRSWEERQPSLYGRFDLAYDGVGPPKLLEYNADTPTGLVEAAVAQWVWLKDIDERGDQFNSIHERLIEAWKGVRQHFQGGVHFAALSGVVEDYITVEYMRDTAIQAGFDTRYLDVEEIGWNAASGQFVDLSGAPIRWIFKLYPWEWILREEYGRHVRVARTHWIEPPWKMILSCKSILPLLYEKFPRSPFLVPASFEPIPGNHVRKPIHAREGSNIQVVIDGQVRFQTEGPYEGPFVYQQLAPMKAFDGRYPVLGSWVVDGVSCGVGIREDDNIITTNLSRFVPHQMVD